MGEGNNDGFGGGLVCSKACVLHNNKTLHFKLTLGEQPLLSLDHLA